MRKNKMNRQFKGKRKGTLSKPKPVDPKVRAAKRLKQAERMDARYRHTPPSSDTHILQNLCNVERIAALRAGTWPLPATPVPSV